MGAEKSTEYRVLVEDECGCQKVRVVVSCKEEDEENAIEESVDCNGGYSREAIEQYYKDCQKNYAEATLLWDKYIITFSLGTVAFSSFFSQPTIKDFYLRLAFGLSWIYFVVAGSLAVMGYYFSKKHTEEFIKIMDKYYDDDPIGHTKLLDKSFSKRLLKYCNDMSMWLFVLAIIAFVVVKALVLVYE